MNDAMPGDSAYKADPDTGRAGWDRAPNQQTDFLKAFGEGSQGVGKLVAGTLSGFASGVIASATRDGRVSVQQIATDAFGNALGDLIRNEPPPPESPAQA
jgi:hypothetical protein